MTPLQCIIPGQWAIHGILIVDGPRYGEIVKPTSVVDSGYTLQGYGTQHYAKKYFVPLIDDTKFDFREKFNEKPRQKEHHRLDA